MTKQEIAVCERTIKEMLALERDSTDPVLIDKVRFARIVVMKMINNLDYRVSIPEPGTVHIFRGDAL